MNKSNIWGVGGILFWLTVPEGGSTAAGKKWHPEKVSNGEITSSTSLKAERVNREWSNLWTLQAHPCDAFPPPPKGLSTFPRQHHKLRTKSSNTWAYWGCFSCQPPQTHACFHQYTSWKLGFHKITKSLPFHDCENPEKFLKAGKRERVPLGLEEQH